MLKKLIIALAIVITITALAAPVSAQAVKGYGSVMGGMWGCGLGCDSINGYGLSIWGGGPAFGGLGLSGIGGFSPYALGGFGAGFPFAGCGF
jgi:hypothetical protein